MSLFDVLRYFEAGNSRVRQGLLGQIVLEI